MKLYALKCTQGYLRKTETGCQSVKLEKATVVDASGLQRMEAFANTAKEAGYTDVCLIELIVTEGNTIKVF
ncbi:MAG: hypothetical protein ACOYU3_01365 [Bacillota bacterium]